MRVRHTILPSVIMSVLALTPALAGKKPVAGKTERSFSIVSHFDIGGTDTGYDYLRVDSAGHSLYVAHGNRVEVLDLPSGKKRGDIEGTHGVHGIEVIADLGKGYTTDGKDQTVTVFDRESLKVLKKIQPTGLKPDALQYDSHSRQLFIVNGGTGDGTLTVIDPVTDTIKGTVTLGASKLEEIGFDGRGRGFVNDEAKSMVFVFDTATLAKIGEWKLGRCEEPTGMAVDALHHRLHSVCGNKVMAVLDTDTGRLVTEVMIGDGPDGMVMDQERHLLFVSNSDGTLDVIRQVTSDQYVRVQVVATGPGARTSAFDAATGTVYVPTVQFGPAPTSGGRKPMLPATFGVLAIATEGAPVK